MKTSLLRIIVSSAVLAYSSSTIAKDQTPAHIKLESEALAFADGKSYGFSVEKIKETYKLIKKLDEMLCGVKDKNGAMTGLFAYNDRKLTITELTALEQESQSPDAALHASLLAAKELFGVTVLPAMNDVQTMRAIIIDLIKEECQKRQRMDSFLLTWSSCKDGQEKETFIRGINSFKELNQFLIDLENFLKDLMYSCPKAIAQLKAQAQQQK